MANSYNSNPIYLDTDMTSGWKAAQTLNTGNLPTTIQNPGPIPRQFGIRVSKVLLTANGTTVAGTVLIADPNDSTVLLSIPVTTTQAPIEIDFAEHLASWRDFKVTGLTATVTKVQIWYRG